ncbi:hypothetical protein BS78_05G008000 [Paspalum vaginatum]|nr:hypothetical protein BS78_05G008000 [Paspalum vaginatum]
MRNWDGPFLVNRMTQDSVTMRKEFLLNLLSFRSNEATLSEPCGAYYLQLPEDDRHFSMHFASIHAYLLNTISLVFSSVSTTFLRY